MVCMQRACEIKERHRELKEKGERRGGKRGREAKIKRGVENIISLPN